MPSIECLRKYKLSTVLSDVGGPDHTRLNHAVKRLFDLYWLSAAYLMVDGLDHTRLSHAVKQ